MLEKVYMDTIEFFRKIEGRTESSILNVAPNTKLIDFDDKKYIVRLDIIKGIITPGKPGQSTLSVLLTCNGKILVREDYQADEIMLKRICQNFKFRLPELLEVYINGKCSKNTQAEALA